MEVTAPLQPFLDGMSYAPPYSLVLAAAHVAALVTSVAALVWSLRRRWTGTLALPLLLPLACLAAIVITTAVGIDHGRGLIIGQLRPTLPADELSEVIAHGMELQMRVALLGAAHALWAALYLAVVAAALAVRSGRRRATAATPALAGIAGGTLVLWGTAVVTLLHGVALVNAFAVPDGLDPQAKFAFAAAAMAHAQQRAARGQLVVAGVSALGALLGVIAAVRAARQGRRAGGTTLALAALVAAGGVALFASTRRHAWDAAHVLPPIDASGLVSGDTIARAPRVTRCEQELQQAPVVDVADQIKIDGQVQTADGLVARLTALRETYVGLHGADDPWSQHPLLLLLAPGDAPAERVAPVFAAARAAGYAEVEGAVVVPHDAETRTLGRITRQSQCARMLALYRPWAAPAGASWADVATRP
jgi:hypothetical protein